MHYYHSVVLYFKWHPHCGLMEYIICRIILVITYITYKCLDLGIHHSTAEHSHTPSSIGQFQPSPLVPLISHHKCGHPSHTDVHTRHYVQVFSNLLWSDFLYRYVHFRLHLFSGTIYNKSYFVSVCTASHVSPGPLVKCVNKWDLYLQQIKVMTNRCYYSISIIH